MADSAADTVARIFSAVGVAAETAGPILPGVAGTIALFAGAAFKFAADLVAAGKSPIVEIQRIHESTPLLAGVQAHWRDQIAAKPSTPSAR